MAEPLNIRSGSFFGIGNPLLDMSAEMNSADFEKYKLKKNQTVLADSSHNELFEYLDEYGRHSIGGSSQNIMRTIAWFLQQKNSIATYMGCVGNDFQKTRLQKLANAAGITAIYEDHETKCTGCCGVLIHEENRKRSMVTKPGASEAFSPKFLMEKDNWSHVMNAEILCSEGFFLISCREAFMRICEYAYSSQKTFCLTLSANFICDEPYGVQLLSALPFADIVFGYEDEAKTLAQKQMRVEAEDLKSSIAALRDAPKWNKKKPRIVIISKVPSKTFVASENGIAEYYWKVPQKITDTHGCGAALAGGFLAYFALGKSIDQCVNAGLYCAYEILQRIGCQFPNQVAFENKLYYTQNNDE